MLRFVIYLPKLPEPVGDIAGGVLDVTISDEELSLEVPLELLQIEADEDRFVESPELRGADNSPVAVDFYYVDDATPPNRSKIPSHIDGTLVDNQAPPTPGSLAFAVVEELFTDTPAPPTGPTGAAGPTGPAE